MDKPEISYPCRWGYRVIGTGHEPIRAAIDEVVGDHEHTLEVGNTSSGGKYVSYHLEVLVHTEASRLGIYEALSEFACIKIVL